MNNLRFLMYTTEKNKCLAELNLKYFFNQTDDPNLKFTILSNKFLTNDFKYQDRVTYLSSGLDFYDSARFVETMKYGLSQIEEEYVFLTLDDFFLIKPLQVDRLKKLLNVIICDNVDFFSFDTLHLTTMKFLEWNKFKSSCDNQFDEHLIYRDTNFPFLYSLQPCIWKKSSLLKIFNECGIFKFHDLDHTISLIKETTKDYINLSTTKSTQFDFNNDIEKINEYFIIAYTEVCRHGVFNIPENGQVSDIIYRHQRYVYKLIENENLENNPEFAHLLNWYKFRDKSIQLTNSTNGYEIWEPIKKILNM